MQPVSVSEKQAYSMLHRAPFVYSRVWSLTATGVRVEGMIALRKWPTVQATFLEQTVKGVGVKIVWKLL